MGVGSAEVQAPCHEQSRGRGEESGWPGVGVCSGEAGTGDPVCEHRPAAGPSHVHGGGLQDEAPTGVGQLGGAGRGPKTAVNEDRIFGISLENAYTSAGLQPGNASITINQSLLHSFPRQIVKYPQFRNPIPPDIPPLGIGCHNTPLDVKGREPLISQRLNFVFWIVWEVLKSRNGRHDWIRTSDLFRVKEAL